MSARYVAQPNKLSIFGRDSTAHISKIGSAMRGIDVFSEATTEYLLAQDIDIFQFFNQIISMLVANGIELTPEQIDRIMDEAPILESMQDRYASF